MWLWQGVINPLHLTGKLLYFFLTKYYDVKAGDANNIKSLI